jgi:hypothetical protein
MHFGHGYRIHKLTKNASSRLKEIVKIKKKSRVQWNLKIELIHLPCSCFWGRNCHYVWAQCFQIESLHSADCMLLQYAAWKLFHFAFTAFIVCEFPLRTHVYYIQEVRGRNWVTQWDGTVLLFWRGWCRHTRSGSVAQRLKGRVVSKPGAMSQT